MAAIALELAVSETTLRRWMKKEDEKVGDPGPAVRREVVALRHEVSRLSIEVELLKRAMANSAPSPTRAY